MELYIYSICHVAINTLVKVLTKKHINFVDVKQMCSHCGHQSSSCGKVNPHIRDKPAASYCLQPFYLELEFSFTITCELLASVMRLSITPSQYIQQAILSVWERKQYKL